MDLIENLREEALAIRNERGYQMNSQRRIGDFLLRLIDFNGILKSMRRDKGYFPSEVELRKEIKYPIVGDVASVGVPYPGKIYRCGVIGIWAATEDIPQAPIYDSFDFVHKAGNETIAGDKTFTGKVSVPEATAGGEAVNKSQMYSEMCTSEIVNDVLSVLNE